MPVATRVPLLVGSAGIAGFAGLFVLVRLGRTDSIDAALTLRIQGRRDAATDALMMAVSWPGFPPQSRVIPPLIIAGLAAAGLRREAIFQTVGWGSAFVSNVAKSFMGRPRPVAGTDLRVVAAPLDGSSFPSGHVMTYVGTYGFLAVLAATHLRPSGPRRLVVGTLTGLIALVGPSRIQQGHHWATDVTASYLLGASYLIALTTLYRRPRARAPGRPR